MAIVTFLTTLEDEFGILIDDDEVSAECFETLGALVTFVTEHLGR
jgi:acyl carrier protein